MSETKILTKQPNGVGKFMTPTEAGIGGSSSGSDSIWDYDLTMTSEGLPFVGGSAALWSEIRNGKKVRITVVRGAEGSKTCYMFYGGGTLYDNDGVDYGIIFTGLGATLNYSGANARIYSLILSDKNSTDDIIPLSYFSMKFGSVSVSGTSDMLLNI